MYSLIGGYGGFWVAGLFFLVGRTGELEKKAENETNSKMETGGLQVIIWFVFGGLGITLWLIVNRDGRDEQEHESQYVGVNA